MTSYLIILICWAAVVYVIVAGRYWNCKSLYVRECCPRFIVMLWIPYGLLSGGFICGAVWLLSNPETHLYMVKLVAAAELGIALAFYLFYLKPAYRNRNKGVIRDL